MDSGSTLSRSDALKARAMRFAVRVVRLAHALRKDPEGRVVATQVLRSGTSIGANYNAACRSRTSREFEDANRR